ncbi:MAG TPA: hypothetical protein VEL74_21740 [Thermoanaerobaculia bacterium]|nr:hypothetical protein [Thermoanaerobaculia bacterium]
MSGAAPTTSASALAVDAAQREVLLEEIAALAAAVRDPESRERYGALHAAVEAGEVGDDLAGALEGLLEMLLQTGRARRIHGADGEQSLLRLFHKTPRGAAARRSTEAVNEALRGLRGQTLENLLFTVQGPGVYRLGLATDRCRLTVEIDRHGVSVESLEV